MKHLLKVSAPYLAVGIFWLIFENAWLTILAYHAQILFWSGNNLGGVLKGWHKHLFLSAALPAVLAFPAAIFLLPILIPDGELGNWLTRFGLTQRSMLLMIPYFGLIHPVLEQAHWTPLRSRGWQTHLLFTGYHGLVLCNLLTPTGLAFCLLVLLGTSFIWAHIDRQTDKGFMIPALGHILADSGIVLAAYLLL